MPGADMRLFCMAVLSLHHASPDAPWQGPRRLRVPRIASGTGCMVLTTRWAPMDLSLYPELPARSCMKASRSSRPCRQEPARMPAGSPERGGMSQEVLLAALTQRARLLLSLRATTQSTDIKQQDSNTDSSEVCAIPSVLSSWTFTYLT